MKIKKFIILILALIIGVIPMVFAGCGGIDASNIDIKMISTADGEENGLQVINLSVDDEDNLSRDLIFEIVNWQDGMSAGVNFSTDSNDQVEISGKKYLADGKVKITVTAKSGGSAIITATTSQYSKQVNILVKISEKIKDFNLKNNIGMLCYEKGTELKLNVEEIFNFSPSSTTERNLKAYIGDTLITDENGNTVISELEQDTTVTFISENLEGVSRNLYIKVVEHLEQSDISFEKLVYSNNATSKYEAIDNGCEILLLKGNNGQTVEGKSIAYNERQIKMTINCNQEDLQVKALIYIKDGENWVRNDLIVIDVVEQGQLENGKYEHIYKLAYSGFNEMKVVFTYSVSDYNYGVANELYFKCEEAPNNLSINKKSESNYEITIYDPSEVYIGKSLNFEVYPQNCIDFKINLLLDSSADSILNVLNSNGINKARETADKVGYKSKIAISNGETIRISAKNATDFSVVTALIEIKYTLENVTYVLEYNLTINIKKSPTNFVVTDDEDANGKLAGTVQEYAKYIFDINTQKIVDENGNLIANLGKNSAKFYVYAELDGILEKGHEFVINNNLGIVNVNKLDGNAFEITANAVGTGKFNIVLENGKRLDFTVEVINSLSSLSLEFPTPTQNSNIYLNNVGTDGYLYEIIALTGAKIPPIIYKTGDLISYTFVGNDLEYKDGYIIGLKDTKDFVECTFTAKHYYLDANNIIQTRTTTFKFKIMFYSTITNFNLSTNKGSTNFDLYNLKSVGYYSEQLATAVITVNISPDAFKSQIEWKSNFEWNIDGEPSEKDENVRIYQNDIFTFSYNTKTGAGTLVCNIAETYIDDNGDEVKTDFFDEKGNFKKGKVVLSAIVKQEQAGKVLFNLIKTVQFDVVNNISIEEIDASVNTLSIDKFKGEMIIYTSVYPVNASNQALRAIFIPNDLSYGNAIDFSWQNNKLIVKLNKNYDHGQGIIRLIAIDSYSTSENFTTYIDIPVVICDGSEEFPYQIISEKDLQILIDTNFEKNYQIVGEIDISKFVDKNGQLLWKYSTYTLTGNLIGLNNACFTGITINNGNNNYGLFASIAENAKISNIKFEGKIPLAITQTELTNIGLIAGQNDGTLENVFVDINSCQITASGGYTINLGGLVGKNNGKILLTNEGAYNKLVNFPLTFNDNSGDTTATHTLFIGGVVGHNEGLIESERDFSNTILVNVDFNIQYVKNNETIRLYTDGDIEGIGGIAGYSCVKEPISTKVYGIKNLTAEGKIVAGTGENSAFVGHFNNVGGLVGLNSLAITNCVSQVYVKGRENVGGGVGLNNNGNLTEVKIQALEKNDYTLIVGNNNVGGIVGNFVYGEINKSTFISYVSKEFGSNYAGDILIVKNDSISTDLSAGRIVGKLSSGNLNYVVAIANLNANCAINLAIKSIGNENIVIYGKTKINAETIEDNNIVNNNIEDKTIFNDDFLEKLTSSQNHNLTLNGIDTLDKFISKIVEYETWANGNNKEKLTSFIILPPTIINKELTETGKKQALKSNSGSEIVFYLELYQKAEGAILDEFSLLNAYDNSIADKNAYNIRDYIKVYANSNTNLVLKSNNENILKIEDGKFVVLSTGLVKITVTSEFNTTLSTDFYVYVVRHVEDFKAYRNADRETSQLTSGTYEVLDKNTSYMLYFKYLDKFNKNNYLESQELLVALQIGDTIIYPNGEIDSLTGLRFTRISSEAYQLTGTKLSETFNDISFIYYYEVAIGEYKYSIQNCFDNVKTINFKYKVINETKKISVSEPEIEVMPYYQPKVDVELVSENANEQITILTYLVDENGALSSTTKLNFKIWLNNTLQNNNFTIDATTYKNFTLEFYLNESDKNITSNLQFRVVIRASNGLESVINITFKPQKLNDLTINLYPEKDMTDDEIITIPNGEIFSYITSNKIIPGKSSLLEFIVVPAYTDFDYILIKNFANNEYKVVFELYDRTTNSAVVGSQDVDGGIKVMKSAIKNGVFNLRIFLDSRITDFSTVTLEIDVIKDEKSTLDSIFTKILYVEQLPGVKLEIDGVKSGNEEELNIALGLEYDMKVFVKGYESGILTFDQASKTYSDGEIRFVLSDISLATIVKDTDGSYKLVITNQNLQGKNRNLKITTYGEKVTATGVKKSEEVVITLNVVDFVVKQSFNDNIIKEIDNGVIYSAVGNTYTFEVTLNDNVLIYDKTNLTIVSKVEVFLTNLSTAGSWYVKDINQVYYGWSAIDQNFNNKYAPLSNNAFKVDIINNKIKITFTKVQRKESPTLLFKFEENFYYNDGVPTIGTVTNGNYYVLSEEFIFDVAEKTNLRNPYPIYTVEELLSMREGNYYILMNDLTLPSDFTPITTLIGGFDGNNYQLTLPASLEYKNAGNNQQFNFGIFETIAEGSLITNLKIYINGEVNIDLTSYPSVNFGIIATNNYGTITNCAVIGSTYAHIIINVNDNVNSSNEPINNIASFVANNYSQGTITNSRVEVSITSKGNVAGFVYSNAGTIASSYVYGSVVNNTISTSSKTAGFVCVNEYGGLVFTSYIAGDYLNKEDQFATSDSKVLYSADKVGAFVYSNSGKISNCYANIPVSPAASRASGFVFRNEKNGKIEYCYSTSKMTNNRSSHTSFVGRMSALPDGILNAGELAECYAFEDLVISTSANSKELIVEFANNKLGSNKDIIGLTVIETSPNDEGSVSDTKPADPVKYFKLSEGKYVILRDDNNIDIENYNIYSNNDNITWPNERLADPATFAKFAISNDSTNTNAVWFFPNAVSEGAYVKDGKYIVLKTNRMELVAPNILSIGHQTFSHTSIDEITGETIYNYINADNLGEIHNPYVISTVEDLELIAENQNKFIGEGKYYRLVNDIIYETGTTSSNLYKYYFLGNLEGNSFTIGNYVIDSSENLESAGFFAGIGSKLKNTGSIKNVGFSPRYINLPNTISVGAVAGIVYGANIINVSVDGFEYDNEGIVILGKNAVGGVAGILTGNYIINNIDVNISVNSTYRASLSGHDVELFRENNYSLISHSGLICGVASGFGKINFMYAGGDNVAIGECVGLMFGYVGKNVVANNLYVTQSSKQYIKSDIYAGIIAGVSAGTLTSITITNNNIIRNSFFADTIYTPIAVGNIVGYMLGGKLQSANVNTTTLVQSGIAFVGGAVGIMQDGEIEDVLITGNISAGEIVGGVVGYVGIVNAKGYSAKTERLALSTASKIKIKNSYLTGNITSTTSTNEVAVGTIVGQINGAGVDNNEKNNIFIGIKNGTNYSNLNINNINDDVNSKISILFDSKLVSKVNLIINNYSFASNIYIRYGIVTIVNGADKDQILWAHDNANKEQSLYIEKPSIYQIKSDKSNVKINGRVYEEWIK